MGRHCRPDRAEEPSASAVQCRPVPSDREAAYVALCILFDMPIDHDPPFRFPIRMKPGFGTDYTREQTVGRPIRQTLGEGDGSVIVEGIVVDWIDEPDGSVTLMVEA